MAKILAYIGDTSEFIWGEMSQWRNALKFFNAYKCWNNYVWSIHNCTTENKNYNIKSKKFGEKL